MLYNNFITINRIFLLPIILFTSNYYFEINPLLNFLINCGYILNIGKILEHFNYKKNYSSIFLLLGTLNSNISLKWFISNSIVAYLSFVQHIFKMPITLALDETAIVNFSIIILNPNIKIHYHIFILVINFYLRYYREKSIFNVILYLYSFYYFILVRKIAEYQIIFLILPGYILMKLDIDSYLWHISNGIFLYQVSYI